MVGHKLGVRALAYAASVLVSAGFEYDAIAWDVTSRERLMLLRGHRHAICAVHMMSVSMDTIKCITLDDGGEYKVWDVSAPTADGFAVCLQSFVPPSVGVDANGPARMFCLGWDEQLSLDEWSNVFIGATRVHHMLPRKTMKEYVSPGCCCYNEHSAQFLSGHAQPYASPSPPTILPPRIIW